MIDQILFVIIELARVEKLHLILSVKNKHELITQLFEIEIYMCSIYFCTPINGV